MSTTVLTAVLAKLTGLSTLAKASVGLAIAVGAVGAASGVPAVVGEVSQVGDEQVVVATTDEPTTDVTAEPSEDPSEEPSAEPGEEPSAEPTDEPTAAPIDDPAVAVPGWSDAKNFGAWVSAQAREGGVDGQEISAAAHERNAARRSASAGVEDSGGADDAEESSEAEDTDDKTAAVTDQAREKDPGASGNAKTNPGRGH